MSHYLRGMSTKHLTIATILFASFAVAACGSDSGGTPDSGIIIFADAGGDAGSVAACNPVANTGCAPSEKCSKINLTENLGSTQCVPDGTAAVGEACTWGDPGETTGFDTCAAKGYCRNGVCREICDSNPSDSCSSGNCVQIFETFDEIDGVGVCAQPCDPVVQDCVVKNEGCYVNTGTGKSSCSRVPEETLGLGQDDDCYGPDGSDGCYLNGCPAGYSPILNKGGPMGPGGSVCAAYCSPVMQDMNNAGELGGASPYTCGAAGAPLGYECRFIQSFYSNTDLVDVSVGMCVPPLLWGSCANFDPADMKAFVPGCHPLPPAAIVQPDNADNARRPKFNGDVREFYMSLPKN